MVLNEFAGAPMPSMSNELAHCPMSTASEGTTSVERGGQLQIASLISPEHLRIRDNHFVLVRFAKQILVRNSELSNHSEQSHFKRPL